jgi:hypothetical protein
VLGVDLDGVCADFYGHRSLLPKSLPKAGKTVHEATRFNYQTFDLLWLPGPDSAPHYPLGPGLAPRMGPCSASMSANPACIQSRRRAS